MSQSPVFQGRDFAAFLFDMDGTILSSTAAAERVWGAWARGHGLDVPAFLATMHGRRPMDTIRQALPDVDAEIEAAAITRAEMDDLDGIDAVAGAAAFLAALPADRWAIVTSAPRALAERRLRAAGLRAPPTMVTGEDVDHGKPDPEGFRRAAERLGFQTRDCLVFEDAPAGVAAAEAAGAAVVVITAGHSTPLATSHPRFADYARLTVSTLGPAGPLRLMTRD